MEVVFKSWEVSLGKSKGKLTGGVIEFKRGVIIKLHHLINEVKKRGICGNEIVINNKDNQ